MNPYRTLRIHQDINFNFKVDWCQSENETIGWLNLKNNNNNPTLGFQSDLIRDVIQVERLRTLRIHQDINFNFKVDWCWRKTFTARRQLSRRLFSDAFLTFIGVIFLFLSLTYTFQPPQQSNIKYFGIISIFSGFHRFIKHGIISEIKISLKYNKNYSFLYHHQSLSVLHLC